MIDEIERYKSKNITTNLKVLTQANARCNDCISILRKINLREKRNGSKIELLEHFKNDIWYLEYHKKIDLKNILASLIEEEKTEIKNFSELIIDLKTKITNFATQDITLK